MDLKNIDIRNDSRWDLLFQAFPLDIQTFYIAAFAGLKAPLVVLLPPLPLLHAFIPVYACPLHAWRDLNESSKEGPQAVLPPRLLQSFSNVI